MTTIRTVGPALSFAGTGALALLAALTIPAVAGTHHDDGIGAGGFFGNPAPWHAVDLSGEQKRAMRLVLKAHGPALGRLEADERTATAAIREKLYGVDPVTPEDLDELARHEIETRSALTRERLATALDVRNTLSSEQIQRIAAIRTSFEQMRMRPAFGAPAVPPDAGRMIASPR